jgi:hypothetical protein
MSKVIDPPHADTWQGKQMRAALAIAKACEHGLPDIHHWIIDGDRGVRGMVRATDHWLADLTAWAEFIAPARDKIPQPHVRQDRSSAVPSVEVAGTCHGVHITIYHPATKSELAQLRAGRRAS